MTANPLEDSNSLIEAPAVDREALMARLDGDRELLKELQQLFAKECPRLKADLHRQLEARDNAALARAAHTLRGMLSTFSALKAEHAAQALELASVAGDLTGAAGALDSVDRQVDRVLKNLAEMVKAA